MTLTQFGWNERWQREYETVAGEGVLPGRVVGEHRTHYQIAIGDSEVTAETPGRVRNAAALRSDLPGVGDFVAVRPSAGDGPATIEAVLPRSTALVRKASGKETPQLLAANVDVVFIVTGLDGDFNLARLERFLALVRDSRAKPVILANKVDLSKDIEATVRQISEVMPGVPVHAIGARAGKGVPDLEAYFVGNQTVVLIGSSGVGKSTLINKLLGRAAQATQDVRAHDSRGKHTTTHRQLFLRAGGGAIIDTPGMRGLETWNATEPAAANFDDIGAFAEHCRFRNCRHLAEPGCAVRAAVAQGQLDAARLAAYTKSQRS